jgi:DNA-directed RNA polymerase specialized sigma subunit
VRKLGRPPTEAKIAEEAGLEATEYCDFLDQYSRGRVTSQLRSQLVDAISELEECDEPFALFYFYEGLTMKEVSKTLPSPRGAYARSSGTT